jgi:hypothetical protein
MGSTVFISKNPDDPNVSALLFSTRSHTDTRDAAQNRLKIIWQRCSGSWFIA